MKKTLFFICICFSFPILAQPVLERSCNMFRDGDRLVKVQVEYKSPEKTGSNQFWDFGKQKFVNEHYKLSYSGTDSLFVGREHRTLYKYMLRNDSLFSLGFENPTTLMDYQKPELQMVFPFHYQDKGRGAYSGTGEYCGRLKLTSQGETEFVADAYGMIVLPSGDTLNNVLRVHSVKKIAGLITLESGDSLDMQVDTYRWYADGYRYPVFETVESKYMKEQKMMKHFATAFYYTPAEQYYGLDNDEDNLEKRERNSMTDNFFSGKNKKREGPELEDPQQTVDYRILINDDNSSISLNYTLWETSRILIMLSDIQGRNWMNSPVQVQEIGSYSLNIPLDTYPRGEYMLQIMVNDQLIGKKIIKWN